MAVYTIIYDIFDHMTKRKTNVYLTKQTFLLCDIIKYRFQDINIV